MQDLIKRYFWVLGAIVVMVCVVFFAKATNHVIEAKYLNDSEHPPKVVAAAPSPTATPVTKVRSKDGADLAKRDIFCSTCTPAAPEVASNVDPSSIVNTSLPLQLVATSVSLDDEESYATIVNTENQRQGSYSIGDQIPGATGKLKEIHFKYVDFENNNHTERLGLNGAPPPVVAVAAPPAGDGSDALQSQIDAGVKKIDDNHYEIDKSLIDKAIADPMSLAKGARVVPAVKDGKPDGFKLYAIRPSSVFSKLGLQNGDTLQSVNNFDLTSAQSALEAFTKLQSASTLQLTVTRRGKQEQLTYSIR
ncbi:MAG TPA: type II secretion system protein GspC [Kofleriaceae bacterium]